MAGAGLMVEVVPKFTGRSRPKGTGFDRGRFCVMEDVEPRCRG